MILIARVGQVCPATGTQTTTHAIATAKLAGRIKGGRGKRRGFMIFSLVLERCEIQS